MNTSLKPFKVRYVTHSGTHLATHYATLDEAYSGAVNAQQFARDVRIDTPTRGNLKVFNPRYRDELFPLVATAIACWRVQQCSTDALIAKCDALELLWRTREVGGVVTGTALALVDCLRAEGVEV